MSETLITEKSKDYELLDSGDGEKLERYGEYVLVRPDPQVIWSKSLGEKEWKNIHARYERSGTSGKWHVLKEVKETWSIKLEGLSFTLKLLPSKHLGVFPEQSANWKWLEDKIQTRHELRMKTNDTNKTPVSVLNLFAYTGGATMACAKAGASVVHVDASKFVVDAAHKNLDDSGLGDKSVRFIVDDVRKFVEREVKRGNTYDVVVMDPPVYGKGGEKEVWKIEEDLLPLLGRVKNLFSKEPLAIVLNGYASGYSSTTYAQVLETVTPDLKGKVESGELAIREGSSQRLLPCGIFAHWEML